MFRITKLALFFLAPLAWGQQAPVPIDTSGKVIPLPACYEQKQEIARLTALLNWYQQQFFALQARQIEQQIAPKEPTRAAKPPAQGEPAK